MKRSMNLTALTAAAVLGTVGTAQANIGFAAAETAAMNIAPTGLPVEITYFAGGTPRYEVSLLTTSGNSMREITLRASDGVLLLNEVDSLDPSDANFYANVVNLMAGGTIGLPAGGDVAANAYPDWNLREIGYDVEGGQLVIESRMRQAGQTLLVDIDADTGLLIDPPGGDPGGGDPGGGDPVDAIGAIGVAENVRPGWIAIEVASTTDTGPAWEVVMLDPATTNVREIEIDADNGAVIEDLPVSLSGSELSEVQFIASLAPLPITLTEGVDLVLAQTGPGDIRFVEFDRENGNLVLLGRVDTGAGVVNVTINPFQPVTCQGDVDGNGIVDFDDLNIVLGNWNTAGPAGDIAPTGGDGFVDFDDLNVLLSDWGVACP